MIPRYLRHSRLCFSALILVLMLASSGAGARRPNVVLIIGDDISVDDFSCYGHPTLRTPQVDALAAAGLRFENAYLTTSSCSPTRTSLITGRYPHNTGAPELHMIDSPILATLPQFPALLREAGYYTVQSGKVHFNGDVSGSFEKLYGTKDAGPGGEDRWVQCLRERPRERPFFMWFASFDAHRGWDMPIEQGPSRPEDVVVPPYQFDGPLTRKDLAHYYNEVARFDRSIGRVVDELRKQNVLDDTVIIVMADNGRPFPRDKTWLYDSGIKTPLIIHWPAEIQKPGTVKSLVSTIDLAPTILELAGVDAAPSMQGVSLVPILRDSSAVVRDMVFAEHNWHVMRAHERMVRHGDWVYIKNNFPGWLGFHIAHWSKDYAPAYHEIADVWRAGEFTPAQERVLALRYGEAQHDLFKKPRQAEMLFNVAKDSLQLHDLAADPEQAKRIAFFRRALEQWTRETGDTIPAAEAMTPDRVDRVTWKTIAASGRPNGGEVPGQSTQAHKINASGPRWADDVR